MVTLSREIFIPISMVKLWDFFNHWHSNPTLFANSLQAVSHADFGDAIQCKDVILPVSESHCGEKTILRPSYLHNGISYPGKTTSLYWIGAQGILVTESSSISN